VRYGLKTMQTTSGLRAILSHHAIYGLFRRLTGSDGLNAVMVEQYIRPRPGDVIVDVGCGPADIVQWLPEVRYYGIDLSEDYLAAARRRWGNRGTFLRAEVGRFAWDDLPPADIVMSLGVLHHLDDPEAVALLRGAKARLRDGGRFVSYDPCFTRPQHPVARAIHRLDRGRNVRFDGPMTDLVRTVFPDARCTVRTDLCRVPSTVLIVEARK